MLPVFSVDFDIAFRTRQQPLNNRMWLPNMPENACSVNQIWESQTFHNSPVAFVFRCCRVISLTVHDGGQNADTIISIPRANIISPNTIFVPLLLFFLRFYGVLFFPQVRIKLLSRVQKCTCCGSLRYCTWNSIFSCTEQGSPQELLCSTYVSDTAVQAPPK